MERKQFWRNSSVNQGFKSETGSGLDEDSDVIRIQAGQNCSQKKEKIKKVFMFEDFSVGAGIFSCNLNVLCRGFKKSLMTGFLSKKNLVWNRIRIRIYPLPSYTGSMAGQNACLCLYRLCSRIILIQWWTYVTKSFVKMPWHLKSSSQLYVQSPNSEKDSILQWIVFT